MKKGMCITYKVSNALYVNVTNACTNSCDFCIRNNGDGAYGSESLWLLYEPSVDEILSSIFSHTLSDFSELVFCGYGEPTCRLDAICEVARRVKAKSDIKIRVNTNGQANLIAKRDTAPDFSVFDSVSISLNASNSEKYESICHPVYKNKTFPAILEFARNVKNYVQNVQFSIVDDGLSEKEITECRLIAEKTGVPLRIREYIPPSR